MYLIYYIQYLVALRDVTSNPNYPIDLKSHTADRDVILATIERNFTLNPLNVLRLSGY